MEKIKQRIRETKSGVARREFLKVTGVATLGLITPAFRGRVLGAKRPDELLLYVGTYTTGKSKGIYLYRLSLSSGELKHVATTKGVVNPSFIALAPNRRYLYAVNEVAEFAGRKSGAVSAFAVEQRTGELELLNQQPSLGADPCYVEVDAGGRFVLIANYTGGNVALFPIERDGSLGAAADVKQYQGSSMDPKRQEGPHAHCIMLDPTNRFAYSCDLGTDRVMIFRFDQGSGKLMPNEQAWVKTKPGAGPRHLAFHPSGKYIFVLNELHSTVTVFARESKQGRLKERQTLTTLPKDFTGTNTSADIHVSPDGGFVYCSNRGHDSIVVFRLNPRNGRLNSLGHKPTQGKTPRNFAIDPTGALLLVANQESNNIVVFRRNQNTGRLNFTGRVIDAPSPVCLKLTTPFS